MEEANFDKIREEEYNMYHSLCRTGATLVRLGLQYAFLPYVVYLGLQQGGETPTGEPVELGLSSLLWG